MQAYYWWWLAALALGIVEMLSGTFYLLVLAVGCAAGGLVALTASPAVAQLIVAAAVSVLGWWLLRRWQPARTATPPPHADPDVLLDIGERVSVTAWDVHGRAQVSYRGAMWIAELEPGAPQRAPVIGEYVIRGIVGNRLLVALFQGSK